MLRKLISWLVMWGLSFLVQWFGWFKQGMAFVIISCIGYGFLALVSIIIGIAGVLGGNGFIEKFALLGFSSIVFLMSAFGTVVLLAGSWAATQLFPAVSFTIAFQLMSFGRCFASGSSKKSDRNDD